MPSALGLVTAIVDHHTLTSPTPYYSFEILYATDLGLGEFLGSPLFNQIVPVNSADVSTIYSSNEGNITASFDWSNLNAPLPFKAYYDGPDYFLHTELVMSDQNYAPQLWNPPQIKSLDPRWSTCILNVDVGSIDPPYALQGAARPAIPVDPLTTAQASFPIKTPPPLPGPSTVVNAPTGTLDPQPPFISTRTEGNAGDNHPGGSSSKPHPESRTSDPASLDPEPDSGTPPDLEQAAGDDISSGNADTVTYTDPDNGSGYMSSFDTDSSDSSGDSISGSSPKLSDLGSGSGIVSLFNIGIGSGSGSRTRLGAAGNSDHEAAGRSLGDIIAAAFGFRGINRGGGGYDSNGNPETYGSTGSENAGLAIENDPDSIDSEVDTAGHQDTAAGATHSLAYTGNQPTSTDPSRKDAIIVAGHTLGPSDPNALVNTPLVTFAPNTYVSIGTSRRKIVTYTNDAKVETGIASGTSFTVGL